jgi:hypothetical protein
MFQLEEEMLKWQQRFAEAETLRTTDLAELEMHLRDSISSLIVTGLSEEEAFLIAVHRVGEPRRLEQEFGKVNGSHIWSQRVFWMIAGFLLFNVCQLVFDSVAWLSASMAAVAGGNGMAIGYATSGAIIICWIALAITLLRWTARQSGGQSLNVLFSRGRVNLMAAGSLLLIVIVLGAFLKLCGRIIVSKVASHNDLGEAAVIFAWTNALLTLLVPVALLIVMCKLQRHMPTSTQIEE